MEKTWDESGEKGALDDKIVLNLKISRQKVCSLKEKLYFCGRNEERRRIFSLKRKKRLVFGSNKQLKEKQYEYIRIYIMVVA